MNIFVLIALAMTVMVVMLYRRYSIGVGVLAMGAVLWVGTDPDPMKILSAFKETASLARNYYLIGCLYFIICLEIILRKSGILAGMVRAMHRMFPSPRVTLAAMPAFLGLLPSMGGARFSAPIVQEASVGLEISPERKAVINYWFRHINEYSCPLMNAMILTAGITGAAIGEIVLHIGWVAFAAFGLGWLILMTPIRVPEVTVENEKAEAIRHDRVDFVLALVPVTISVILMVATPIVAPLAMLIAVIAILFLARAFNRVVGIREVFVGALDWKMFANVSAILFFIQILDVTGTLTAIVDGVGALGLPVGAVIAVIAFLVGLLTGQAQGHISMMMPIVAAISGADLYLIGIAYVFGMAGEMISPAHLCMAISVDYFKAKFVPFWMMIFATQMIVLALFSLWTFL